MTPSDWPMEARIEHLTDEGEWIWAGDIRSVKIGKTWIAKRKDPARWRAVSKNDEKKEV